jgi:hypothetical protein
MDCTILIYTNSAYSYLWPVIQDHIQTYEINKVIAYDKGCMEQQLPLWGNNSVTHIAYDGQCPFHTRMFSILEQISSHYVYIVYDVDIIVNLNENALVNYVSIMKQYNIDRCSTCVFDGVQQWASTDRLYALCNLNAPLRQQSNHLIPIDCSPTIWKRSAYIDFVKKFPSLSYSQSELDKDAINYCRYYLKCAGIQLGPQTQLLYNRGLTYCNDFSFLHITTKGSILVPLSVYDDYESELVRIIDKYNFHHLPKCLAPQSCIDPIKLKY